MASIAEYLVYIAQRPDAARTHYESTKSARQQMTTYGLTTVQQDTILGANPNEINDAIVQEIGTQKGLSITYHDEIVHSPGNGGGS
jgi:hypothetical protein